MDVVGRVNASSRRTSPLGTAWLCLLALLLAAPQSALAQWHERNGEAMGTSIRVELWHADRAHASQALDEVMAEMQRIDHAFSPYREDSELSRLNQQGPNGWTKISPELLNLLQISRRMSERTDGAFDVTFASVGRYYDYRESKRPDAATLDAAVQAINYQYVELNVRRREARYAHPKVYVDLGGIAKGYAVDRAIKLLQQAGVTQASVGAGGDSRILGDRRGQPWTVGVRHPRDDQAVAVRLPLENTALSTSGDYERFFVEDGVRYHHILNPTTGTSADGALSVTVLGPNATVTDALSTSVFVLGPEAGLALINELDGIDAIVIDPTGRMRYSDGLAGLD